MVHLLKKYQQYQLLFASVCLLLVLFNFLPLSAATNNSNANTSSGAIAQGYQTTEKNLVTGAVMSLKTGTAGTVELANTDRVEHLLGVIGSKALIELSTSDNSVQVVTSGVTDTLVSDLEGDIVTGDRITASPIDGVGMKASATSIVLGTAQTDLKNIKTTEHFITDKDGKVHTVHIGLLPVQINVTFFAAPGEKSAFIPVWLQDLANTLAGKQVSAVRVLIGLVVMLVAFVSIGILLYASVRSSIISIGRNPLSEGGIRKGLLQIGLIVIAILLFTLITLYLILTT